MSSSRIIIKSLPKYITSERLEEMFSSMGVVTDVKLVKTKDGRFRRFAYIGYIDDASAAAAVKYYNNTFIDTCKIAVTIAKTVVDESIDRPWSKYSAGSTAFDKALEWKDRKLRDKEARQKGALTGKTFKEKKSGTDLALQQEIELRLKKKAMKSLAEVYGEKAMLTNDGELSEFLALNNKQLTSTRWQNDDYSATQALTQKELTSESTPKTKIRVDMVAAKRPAVDGVSYARTHVTFEESDKESDDEYQTINDPKDDEEEDEKVVYKREDKANKVAINQAVSDMDYFRQKMVGSDISDFESSGDELLELFEDPKEEEKEGADKILTDVSESTKEAPAISDTGAIYVRNLSYLTTEEHVETFFSKYGELAEVHLPLDKESKQAKGYATIVYVFPEDALKAFSEMNGKIFMGRLIHLLPAHSSIRSSEQGDNTNTGIGGLDQDDTEGSYKRKLEKQRKATAGDSHNWNSLFMRSDTVLDAISIKLGIKKSDILTKESGSMAVKMALSETHIIQETKQYLEQQGVNLESFKSSPHNDIIIGGNSMKRSKTAIIVKNIPFTIETDQLADLFGKFGLISKIVLPATKTIAIINFIEAQDARSAFKNLAYSKFNNVPLFLEFAPFDIFTERPADTDTNTPPPPATTETPIIESVALDDEKEVFEDANCTIFIKNLSFNTNEEALKTGLKAAGDIRSITISKKRDPKNVGQWLSMGYGFVQYKSPDSAQKAMRTLQHTMIDGHAIELKLSTKKLVTSSNNNPSDPNQPTNNTATANKIASKLIIRNVAFEANKKELRELLSSIGSLKTLRLPTKFDGSHRGFAFVEFATKKEAERAKKDLESTHFYGRHLVIEYANDDESVEQLQEKTQKKYDESSSKVVKKIKIKA